MPSAFLSYIETLGEALRGVFSQLDLGELPLVLFATSGTDKVHQDYYKIKPQVIFLVRQVGGETQMVAFQKARLILSLFVAIIKILPSFLRCL